MNPVRKILAVLTPGDKILVFSLLLCSLFLNYFLVFNTSEGKIAVIWINGKEFKRINLSQEQQLEFAGSQGRFRIQVKANAVRMLESTCPDKLCLKMGAIRKPNQVIVCIPNRVVIKIEGGTVAEQFDLITE